LKEGVFVDQQDVQALIRKGIEAAQKGDKVQARRILLEAVNDNPRSEVAWMWLASVTDAPAEKRRYLQRVLQLNPNNNRAKQAIDLLGDPSAANVAYANRQRAAVSRATLERAEGQRGLAIERMLQNPIAWVVLGIVVTVLGVIGVSNFSNIINAPPATATPEIIRSGTDIQATAVARQAIISPPTLIPTATLRDGVLVTLDPNRALTSLPPTFTPTPTVTPPPTFTPTPTSFPISDMQMLLVREGNLYTADGDGSNATQILENARQIAISPDGTKLAFVRDGDYPAEGTEPAGVGPQLFVAPLNDPAAAVQITRIRSTSLGNPTWGPDNISLAFNTNYDGDEELFTLTEDGNNLRQLTTNDGIDDTQPAWSPESQTLLFVSNRDSAETKLYTLDVGDPEEVRLLTDAPGNNYAPAWSPDGQLIVFASDRNGDGDIFFVEASGSNTQLLTVDDNNAEDSAPVFTASGLDVVFVSNRSSDNFQIYQVDLQGRAATRLTDNDDDDTQAVYIPNFLARLR
jgi:hypothetical protein